ncbi:MAG: adenylate/guanylate cyclase domain-containing protein [Leptospiraceae bacterium]|nr:adenylate/guanylate cyclase domain-containing protein [Leptospiraceae bacterium]
MSETTIVDNILRERELKNEKRVAWIRFIALCPMAFLDLLAYLNIIQFTEIPPNLITIALDFFFVLSGATVLILLIKNKFPKFLTYLVLTFDYSFVLLSILFDPTVSKETYMISWVALVGPIFFYFINLLRYSKQATIYAGFLSIVVYLVCVIHFNAYDRGDFIPMLIVMITMLGMGYSITSSNKEMMIEANTKKLMERYLPPQLIGELYTHNASLEPGGKIQRVSILFSDIRSFTSISESMSPEEIVYFLNDYLSDMTEIIFNHQGTIDKFIGDAIMTIFGAPIQGKDDALRAIKTAIEMNFNLSNFNKKHPQLEKGLEVGIGIHTGEVIAGNIGSDKRLDYTVIGDAVNLSSRIQDLTKFYKCPILISESTKDELSNDTIDQGFVTREVDKVIVKGKTESVKIFEILYFKSEKDKDYKIQLKENFEIGLNEYYLGDFSSALKYFNEFKNDSLSQIYKERCEELIKFPPSETWNGVFKMISK